MSASSAQIGCTDMHNKTLLESRLSPQVRAIRMVSARKPSSGKSVGRKAGRPSSGQRFRPHLRPTAFDEDWQSFTEDVQAELQRSINLPEMERRSTYHDPVSVVKRMAYAFVLYHRPRTSALLIGQAIDRFRHEKEEKKRLSQQKLLRKMRKKYEDEPFYLVLSGLKYAVGISDFEIGEHDVSRFASQLTYADRHGVPQHFLIGFLLQTGSLSEVVRRAKDPNRREQWYLALAATSSAP